MTTQSVSFRNGRVAMIDLRVVNVENIWSSWRLTVLLDFLSAKGEGHVDRSEAFWKVIMQVSVKKSKGEFENLAL